MALAEECAFHPGMMLATTRALNALGGSIRNAVLICLEEDEEQYVQRAHRSISLQPAAPVELLGTMSLLPGGGFTPTAVVSRIHKRYEAIGMVALRYSGSSPLECFTAVSLSCMSQAARYGAASGAAARAELTAL